MGNIVQSVFGSKPKTVTTSNDPTWISDAAQNVFNNASSLADQPYQSYTGDRVAPLSANQETAAQLARGQIGRFDPTYSQIKDLYGQASTPYTQTYSPSTVGYQNVSVNPYSVSNVSTSNNPQSISTKDWTQANVSAYMNPYLEAALKPQIDNINQDYSTRQNTLNSQAAGSGNFGGSRQALLNSLLTKQQQDEINGVRSQGYNTAYNTAQSAFQNDQNRNLQGQTTQADIFNQDLNRRLSADQGNQSTQASAGNNIMNAQLQAALANQKAGIDTGEFNASQLADAFKTNYGIASDNANRASSAAAGLNNLVNTQSGVTNNILGNLLNTGALQQTGTQQGLNDLYQNFLDQRDNTKNNISWLASLLQQSPSNNSQSSQTLSAQNSGSNGLASAATLLASLFGG